MTDGAASTASGTASDAMTTGGLGRVDGTGGDDLESRSSVMRVEDTILFASQFDSVVDCFGLTTLHPKKKSWPHGANRSSVRAAG